MVLQKRQELITLDTIFTKLSSYDIYKYYLQSFKIGIAIKNPLRKDSHPSFSIYEGKDGKLHHIDYADERYRGNCIDLVMQIYQIPFKEAVIKVGRDFGLTEGADEYKKIIEAYKQPEIAKKQSAKIQVSTKAWTTADRKYWGQYNLTVEELKEDSVYSLNEVYVNRSKFPIKKDELVYGYYYPEGFKIYMPERSKEQGKWISSIPTSLLEGIETLNGHPEVIVTKAKKDKLLLRKMFPQLEIISCQNESGSGLTDEVLEKLKGKEIYINFDSDPPGKRASTIQTQRIGCKHINVPDSKYVEKGIKDMSDWYKEEGPEPIISHFREKGVIS